MKKIIAVCLASVLLLPLMMLGCNKEESPPKTIDLTINDFMSQKNMVKDIELTRSGSLTVNLESNPTTGFAWEEAVISDKAVVTQASHNFAEPQTEGSEPVVGAPGKDVWVFDAKAAGTATIKMSYSRPWEGGEKDEFTLTINVTVK